MVQKQLLRSVIAVKNCSGELWWHSLQMPQRMSILLSACSVVFASRYQIFSFVSTQLQTEAEAKPLGSVSQDSCEPADLWCMS